VVCRIQQRLGLAAGLGLFGDGFAVKPYLFWFDKAICQKIRVVASQNQIHPDCRQRNRRLSVGLSATADKTVHKLYQHAGVDICRDFLFPDYL